MNEDGGPETKRKKYFTRNEIISKLTENENDVKKVVSDIVEELSPFDIKDEDAMLFEDRLDRLEKVSKNLLSKVYKLKNKVKEKNSDTTLSYLKRKKYPAASLVSFSLRSCRMIYVRISPSQKSKIRMKILGRNLALKIGLLATRRGLLIQNLASLLGEGGFPVRETP